MAKKIRCRNCEKEIKTHEAVRDFYGCDHCSDACLKKYAAYRDEEYDNYADPTGFYRSKALSEWD